MTCPLCGAALEVHVGIIEEPVMSPWRDGTPVPPIHRLGKYVLCTGCEYGEELTKENRHAQVHSDR